MTMQTDILSGHLHQSGFIIPALRSRIKSVSIKGSASAGQFDLFSTLTAPISGTYAQSGTTVTVTKSNHGLITGEIVGITYSEGTGGGATPGNYPITKVDANTFTITDPNSNSITAGAACKYVNSGGRWLMTFELAAGDTFQNYFLLPGEGLLARQKVYAYMSNIAAATVFYA